MTILVGRCQLCISQQIKFIRFNTIHTFVYKESLKSLFDSDKLWQASDNDTGAAAAALFGATLLVTILGLVHLGPKSQGSRIQNVPDFSRDSSDFAWGSWSGRFAGLQWKDFWDRQGVSLWVFQSFLEAMLGFQFLLAPLWHRGISPVLPRPKVCPASRTSYPDSLRQAFARRGAPA